MIKAKFKSRVAIPKKKISAQLDLPGRCREEDSYYGGWAAAFMHQDWPKSSMSRSWDGVISPLQCDAD